MTVKPRKSPSFSFLVPEETADQVRAAFQATGALEGYSSVNDLLVAATLRELRRLQRKHNGGRSWSGLPKGVLRTGMRTKAEKLSTVKGKG
ncbi:hypothetical protein SAMN04489740_4256 [Arthrobacter alpinus]|uniref:ParB-like C-terminal domain-containing protein n=1 Tax=Arthrobacter alpinus TaxID=656366 RepID=A0A1H5PFP6_9MICC|nr:hypothetical protein [Arthrobacter alpinus]SEF12546.1 hypothetical protein SAMN04489740_4256 [Arthrobacter alpinus]